MFVERLGKLLTIQISTKNILNCENLQAVLGSKFVCIANI